MRFKLISAKKTWELIPYLERLLKFMCDVDDVEITIEADTEKVFGGETQNEDNEEAA